MNGAKKSETYPVVRDGLGPNEGILARAFLPLLGEWKKRSKPEPETKQARLPRSNSDDENTSPF